MSGLGARYVRSPETSSSGKVDQRCRDPYPPPQPARSGGGDNSGGGENTSHTTQATSRMKKQNEWTHDDEKNLVLLNLNISLSFI
jgi:hypothetical protein